jgi:hypothetical protein
MARKKDEEPDAAAVDVELMPDDETDAAGETDLVLARDIFPGQLPIIALNHRPLFPKMQVPMIVDNEPLKEMLVETSKANSKSTCCSRRPKGRYRCCWVPSSASE